MPTRASFKMLFAYIKQSNSGDVSEGLEDTIILIVDDAGAPALDTVTVSHFALASCHSLRGIDLLDIIPGFKFLKKQNSLLGLLVAFNFIFDYQRKFRNFLNTMTFRHDQCRQSGSVARLEGSGLISAHCNLCLLGSNREIPGRGDTQVTSATLLAGVAVLPAPQRGASRCRAYETDGLGWSHPHKENGNWKR
ncbi:hypothetical protein AAY473_037914 [Plecturocebus cupreus]